MNIDHRRLRAVVRVAEELSFSRAAEHLRVSQPALSAQVHNLEKELGFPLFERSTRRVALTDNGERFVSEARELLRAYERLERFARVLHRETETRLAVGAAIYTIDFPDRIRLLDELIDACADIDIEVVTGGAQTEITRQLRAGQLDLAILMGVAVSTETYAAQATRDSGREVLIDDALRRVVLKRQPVALLVPEESALARRQRVSKRDLAGQPVAIFHSNHGAQLHRPLAEHLRSAGADLVLPPEPNAIGVERYGRQHRIAAVTLGWFPQPADGDMVRRPLTGLALATDLVLAAQPGVSSPAMERALTFAREFARRQARSPAKD